MTYAEAIRWLEGLIQFGLQPGLDTTRRLAARAGAPQQPAALPARRRHQRQRLHVRVPRQHLSRSGS